MNVAISAVFNWLRGVLDDPMHKLGSYVRVSGSFVIVTTMALVWFSTAFQRDIPPMAQSVLLALIAAVLGNYIANKYAKPSVPKPTEQPTQEQKELP